MGMAISIFIGAIGAILRYAVTGSAEQQGFNVDTVGAIFMFVGVLGLMVSVLFWSPFAPFARRNKTVTLREESVTKDGHALDSIARETREQIPG